MRFQIDFNAPNKYDDNFLIDVLGAEFVPTDSDKYPPFEILQIEIKDFEHLEEILKIVDKEFNCISTALISFDSPTIYIDLE